MKSTKIFTIFLSILFLMPLFVSAENCDTDEITITSLEQKDIEGATEVISDSTFEGRNINFDLKMHAKGDSISYNMTITNSSDEDYMIDENTFTTDSEYIEYSLQTKDGNNVVKAKSSKEVVLSVTYKTEVDDALFENNKYNATNSLKLSLNTNEKEKKMDIITTDNIKKDVKNPNTNSSGKRIVLMLSILSAIILLLTIYNKTKINKYIMILFITLSIPIVYAVCTAEIKVESKIEIEKIPTLTDTLVGLSNTSSCMTKYEGNVTDEVGKTVPATKVYFDTCEERNVIFGGFCWQIIRTTETGGTKLLYNGEPMDGKCESSRGDHKGIIGSTGSTEENVASEYLYGTTFTYNTTTGEFMLENTTLATWNDSTYQNLIGKFTCINTNGTCTTLYNVSGYNSATTASLTSYRIGDTNYAQIGKSLYNIKSGSLSGVGYMFNKVYSWKNKVISGTNKFGSTFTYTNGTYTISGTTQDLTTLSGANINNTHYTCWNDTGTCSNIAYVYGIERSSGYYIEISEGKSITDAVNEMLYDDNVNNYNSNIKGVIDSWYSQNLSSKTNMLEDAVYCNARNISNQSTNGWNPEGGSTSINMAFKNAVSTTDMTCMNLTDQFAVGNNKAKLTYPVGLLQEEERYNINTNSLMATDAYWWGISPINLLSNTNVTVLYVYTDGRKYSHYVYLSSGVRPAISLNSHNIIASGTGTEIDPWIIKED